MLVHMRFAVVALCGVLAAALPAPALGARRAAATTPRDQGAAGVCRKLPAGKRIVRLSLKPDTNLADLIAWISSITCKQFILPGTIPAASRTVTIISPQLLTPEEAYSLFLDALDSMGLTLYRTGPFLVVIETAKAHASPIRVVLPGDDWVD